MTQEYEKLSALVDGETNINDTNVKEMVKNIGNNAELNAKWRSYHLTRDLMRSDMSTDLSFNLSDKIAQALEQEMPILAPKPSWRDKPVVAAVLPIVRQSGQLAMVACVTALVIFGFQTYNKPEVSDPFLTAPPILGPQGGLAPVSLPSNAATEQQRMSQLLEQRRQINALIQDHLRQQKLRSVANQADMTNNEIDEENENSQNNP